MNTLLKDTRRWILFFMMVLFLSGLTAVPVEAELGFLSRFFPLGSPVGDWLDRVYLGFHDTNIRYPFLAYGYDWLAFAHFVLAILFIGPYKDPVKNKWVIEFGMIACLLILPFSWIAGAARQIPFWWRLVDSSFGLCGLLPLAICLKKIKQMESITNKNVEYETGY